MTELSEHHESSPMNEAIEFAVFTDPHAAALRQTSGQIKGKVSDIRFVQGGIEGCGAQEVTVDNVVHNLVSILDPVNLLDVHTYFGPRTAKSPHSPLSRQKVTAWAMPLIARFVSYVRSHPEIQYIICPGDLIEDTRDQKRDWKHMQAVVDMLKKTEKPIIYLPGNHDKAGIARSKESTKRNRVRRLKKIIGIPEGQDFCRVINRGSHRILLLDTYMDSTGAPQAISPERIDWLDKTIKEEETPVIVVTHHPLWQFPLDENPWFRDKPERAYIPESEKVREVLNDNISLVRAVISGHLHQTHYAADPDSALNYHGVNSPTEPRPKTPEMPSRSYGHGTLRGSGLDMKERLFYDPRPAPVL